MYREIFIYICTYICKKCKFNDLIIYSIFIYIYICMFTLSPLIFIEEQVLQKNSGRFAPIWCATPRCRVEDHQIRP